MGKRNDYLKQLNEMRSNYQRNGNAMINNADDTTNVGEELSSFAYMNTPMQAPEQEERKDHGTGNVFQDAWNDLVSYTESFAHGALGAIEGAMDFILNVGNTVGDWFGADTSGLSDFIQTDWSGKATGAVANAMTGKGFNPEWESTVDTSVGQFFEGVTYSIGNMLPSIALGGAGFETASQALFAFGAGGGAVQEALAMGKKPWQAELYGALTAVVETATEQIGGVVPWGESAKIASFKDAFKMFGNEALEEVVSGLVEPFKKAISFQDANELKGYGTADFWVTGQDSLLMQGLAGGVSGVIMGGAQTIAQNQRIKTLKKNIDSEYGAFGKTAYSLLELQDASARKNEFEKKHGISEASFDKMSEEQVRTALSEQGISKKEANEYIDIIKERNGKLLEFGNEMKEASLKATEEEFEKFGKLFADPNAKEVGSAIAKMSVSKDGYNIVSKDDVERIQTTKAVSKADGQPIFVQQLSENASSYSDGSYQNEIIRHNDYQKSGYYVYSENPFYASDYKEELSFDKISKTFGMPASIRATYEAKSNAGYDKLVRYLSDYTGLKINEITEKLGYDVYIDEQKGDVVLSNGDNIIKGGILDGKQEGNGNVRPVGRDVGDNTDGELREYLGRNGKEIGQIQQRLEYAQKIAEQGLYGSKDIGNHKGVKIIDNEYLTPKMKEMVSFGEKIGVKVNYAVGYEGKAFGFYEVSGQEVVVYVDYAKNVDVFELTKHEICHHAFARYLADYNLHLTSQLVAISKNSWTVKRLIDKYEALYSGIANADVFEEIVCQIYSGAEKLPHQFAKYQQSVIRRIDELFAEDPDVVSEGYYKDLADMGYSVSEEEKERNGPRLNIAITATEDLSVETYDKKMPKIKEIMSKAVTNVSKLTGVKMEFDEAIGGYLFEDGSDIGGEPSLPVTFDSDTPENKVTLVGCLLSTSAYEYQESVGTVIFKDDGTTGQTTIYLSKVDENIKQAIIDAGLKYYTLNVKAKTLTITGVEGAIINKALSNLENGGYIDGSRPQDIQACEAEFLGPRDRADFCKAWLENKNNPQDGELRNLVQKCYEVDNFVSNHTLEVFGDQRKGIKPIFGRSFEELYKLAHAESEKQKIISDLQAKSSNVLIEAGADVSKPVKYRIEAVKQAVIKTLQDVLPDSAKFKITQGSVKQDFAELNLAKPKDRDIALTNSMKGILATRIEIDGTKYKLEDFVPADSRDVLKGILSKNLDGIAEPTKLAQWAKALSLGKLENQENIRGAKLLASITNKIERSLKNTFGYGDVATGELTLYKNVLDGIKPFFDNKTIVRLADNVLSNYTEDNVSKLYDSFGISYNPLIPLLAQEIKAGVEAGKHLDPRVRRLGNDLLQMLKNDLDMVAESAHDAKVKTARENVGIVQGIFFGNEGGTKSKFLGKIQEALARFDRSIVSPSMLIHAIMPESPLDRHFSEVASEYEDREIAKKQEIMDFLFKGTNGGADITKELGKKFKFKSKKITYAYALKQLNVQRTLGEDYYKVKGAVTNANGTRGEMTYSREDIAELKSLIPQGLLDWNERFVKEGLNGKLKDFVKERYRAITKTELPELEEGRDWYHISRVTDKALPQKGGARGNTPDLSYLSKRVNSVADLNLDGDVIQDTINYVDKVVKDLTWYEWVQETNVMLNQRIYGTTLNAIMQKNVIGWDEIVDLTYHQVLGIPYENTKTLFGKIFGGVAGNVAKANVLGLQTAIRTISSAPWFSSYFGVKTSIAGGILSVKHGGIVNAFKRNAQIIKDNSPYLKARLEGNEVISAETSQKMSSKLSKILGTPMRITDGYIVVSDFGFSCAQAKAMEEGYGDPYTDSNNKRAVQILEEAVKKSQPTNSVLNVGGFRYGQYGSVVKLTFGMFASQIQSFYSGIRNAVNGLVTTDSKIKKAEASIEHHKEREEFYALEEKNAIKEMETMDAKEYEEAMKKAEYAKWKQDEHKQARESQENWLKGFKAKHAGKKKLNELIGSIAGLLASALGYVLLNRLIQIGEGKKSIKDWDGIVGETAEQALFKSVPYISTIYYAIKNDSDLSVFTVDNINGLIKSVKGVVDAIGSGNAGHLTGASVSALKDIAMYFGIPAKSVWKMFNGLWYNADRTTNLSFNEWMGYLSSNKLRSNYHEAVKKGDERTAKANLEVWAYNYSSKASSAVIDEIYRLNRKGYSGITPVGISRSYTDEEGNKHAYSSAQINAFKEAYAKADREMLALIRSSSYQSLDDEYKAKAVSSLYSCYNEYAKARRDGTQVSSKIAKLLEATNGDLDLAKYIAGLKTIGMVSESRGSTRKDNVIKAINRMSGMTKTEKLLLAYLGGYSIGEKNKNLFVSYLTSIGFDRKSALAFAT